MQPPTNDGCFAPDIYPIVNTWPFYHLCHLGGYATPLAVLLPRPTQTDTSTTPSRNN